MAAKVVVHTDIGAEMDNVYPAGDLDKFKVAFPFGFVSKIPKGVTGFYLSLFGSSQELITIGNMHFTRPKPTGDGDAVFYCTDASGTIKSTIYMKNDGSVTVQAAGPVNINSTGDTIITATGKVKVNSTDVTVGSGANEMALNGETHVTAFNEHMHLDLFGLPTQPPTIPLVPIDALSQTVKLAK